MAVLTSDLCDKRLIDPVRIIFREKTTVFNVFIFGAEHSGISPVRANGRFH